MSKPRIYIFSNVRGGGDGLALAMAADGVVLGSHWCSHEGWVANAYLWRQKSEPNAESLLAALQKEFPQRKRLHEERAVNGALVPMLLWCPQCGQRHIDEGEFATKLHHTHACQECGHCWRPAIVATVGVRFLPGFKNGPTGAKVPSTEAVDLHDATLKVLRDMLDAYDDASNETDFQAFNFGAYADRIKRLFREQAEVQL